jgi:dsDNA-specific endonuclease/ATPase MutS2
MSKSVLHLDLHPIAKNGRALDEALREGIDTATSRRLKAIEIIPGKGSGQLMKRVKKFLDQPEIKNTYKRIEIDSKNHGRLFVYFR